MKILFVTHYSGLYGANQSLLDLIEGLKPHGVESLVVAPSRGDLSEVLEDRNVPHVAMPFKWWMSRPEHQWKAPARLLFNLVVAPIIALRVAPWSPDLIHTNSSVTPIGALIAELLSLPHTWHIREFGDLDYGMRRDFGDGAFCWGLSRTESTIAVSEAVRQHIPCVKLSKNKVIYNGVVSEERIHQLKSSDSESPIENEQSSPYTFAIIGRVQPSKGQRQAIRAVSQLRKEGESVRLLIAGDGNDEYLRDLRRLIRQLGVSDAISFLGFVSEPFRVYQKADAVLMCSKNEAMGRVTVEGMAAGRPVIGCDRGGTSELVDHNRNGLLYDGSTDDLVQCMRRLIADREWGYELGRNGWKKASKEFTIECYSRKMLEVFESVCQKEKSD